MKIAIIGATGGTGKHTVERALQLGHEVVAVARRPEQISPQKRLIIRKGDVLNGSSLAEAIAGVDVVISCIGPSGGSTSKGIMNTLTSNFSPGTVMSEGIPNIVEACRRVGVKRFVMQSGIGLSDGKELSVGSRLMLGINRRVFSKAITDKRAAEQSVQRSNLDWVIVRPAGLSHAEATLSYTAGPAARIAPFQPLSFADCADSLVRAATTEPGWIGKIVNVGK
ncbi:NAD(P)-dependent oxidoreductase [Saccharibacillus sp. JS10]|uniref:NAD(P)-dependent oxidoreductase n=1 Tax=Saccharibacillus sp. JS10 TaxID=2950552 RepID=UPI00210883F9|nr:NAD(P)H-binding protein [Saccharibacillus sp. JS10]MCQ4088331.1 NAD(P)H-binding protein [Saccharibacillus sp. JS10]